MQTTLPPRLPYVIIALGLLSILSSCSTAPQEQTTPPPQLPNIVLIYVDDLGYGDLGCYGATGVETPNIDRLASKGKLFTDAHCAAATCTPSRYTLLTGEYAFRNRARVLPGDAPLIIDTNQLTLPKVLQNAGYATGVVGKWHLGLGSGNINWNEKIYPGPLEVGFNYSYLIPATGDRVPTVYVENHQVVNLDPTDPIIVSYQDPVGKRPIGLDHPELLRQAADEQHAKTIVNGISRIGYMAGGEKALWVDEDFPDTLTQKARQFIQQHQEQPFFLFYAHHDIHVPRLPHPRFQHKSTLGPRGDAIVQMDWMVGEVLKELDTLGLSEQTLIIFTSDNGPVLNDGYEDLAIEQLGDHQPAGPLRGGKYSAFEAGTRVPTIVSWPNKIAPGRSDALLGQVDLFASIASLINQPIPLDAAIDSQDHLAAWLGEDPEGRQFLLEESMTRSLRDGQWKYIHPAPYHNADWITNKGIEGGISAVPQLYDLTNDLGEQHNVAEQNPTQVARMEAYLYEIKSRRQRQE